MQFSQSKAPRLIYTCKTGSSRECENTTHIAYTLLQHTSQMSTRSQIPGNQLVADRTHIMQQKTLVLWVSPRVRGRRPPPRGGGRGITMSTTLDAFAGKYRQCYSTGKELTPRGSAFSWITLKMPSMMGQSTFSFFANFAAALH